jgi:hypothetical protein
MNDDFAVDQQLQAELDRGENVVWQAKAHPRLFSAKGIFPAFFGLIWLGVVGTMIFTDHHGRGLRPVSLFPLIPFSIVGLVFVAAPLLRLFGSRRTFYLITNKRAMIVTLGSTKRVQTYYPEKLQSLERRERSDDRGDIIIERTTGISAYGGYQNSRYLQEVGFMNIPDVKNVEGLLRDLARSTAAKA